MSHTVETKYTLKDATSPTLSTLKHGFHSVAEAAEHAKEKIGHFGKHLALAGAGAIGVGFGFHFLSEKVLGIGEAAEETRERMAGAIYATSEWSKKATDVQKIEESMAIAKEEVASLREELLPFAMSAGEGAQAYSRFTTALGGAKGTLADVRDMTKYAAAAHKVFGIDTDAAAESMAKLIQTGKGRLTGEFGGFLMGHIDPKKFAKMSQAKRMKTLMGAVDELPAMAEEMSRGFGDTVKKMGMSVNSFFAQTTGPLFEKIADKLGTWSKRLEEAKKQGKDLIGNVANKLVAAFEKLEHLSAFALEHWKSIAMLWGGSKALGMLWGVGKNLTAMGKTEMFGTTAENLGSFAGKLGIAVGALGAFAAAAQGVADWLLQQQDERMASKEFNNTESVKAAATALGKYKFMTDGTDDKYASGRLAVKLLKGAGAIDLASGTVNRAALHQALGDMTDEQTFGWYKTFGIKSSMAMPAMVEEAFAKTLNDVYRHMPELFQQAAGTKAVAESARRGSKVPQNVTNIGAVYITQDFKDQDPDRIWVRFKRGFEDLIEKPTHTPSSEELGI